MLYEVLYIIHPNVDEAARKQLNEMIFSLFNNNGAQIAKVEDWGSRDLAYEIKKCTRGYYMLLNVESDNATAILEFERVININENVLRHLVVNLTTAKGLK